MDRIDDAALNSLAAQTAQRIREARADEDQLSVLVVDFFRNSVGTPSRLGSLLADRFSESLSAYSGGLKILDRKILKDYLTQEWTTLEDLSSNEVCLRIGRQLGAYGVIVGIITDERDSVKLSLKIEGFGPKNKKEDLFPWKATIANFLLTKETREMLFQPGPNYSRKAEEIQEEPGVFKAGHDGVTSPQCAYCPDPEYSDAARAAKFQGTVVLSVVVTAQGQATGIYVLKGAPFGLTSQAIAATKNWRFEPALKDGKPVPVRVSVEITFKLL